MNSITALLLPPILLVPLMGILSRFHGTTVLAQELRRKALHVGVGLTALAFPTLFRDPWTITIALGLILAWMTAVRSIGPLRERFGGVLHDTDRKTHGEIYFALALAVLLMASAGEPLHYIIPVLILTLADAAAAIVGRAWPIGRLGGFAGDKTQSGCATFFVVAYLITVAVLSAMSPIGPVAAISVALVVAASTCIAETLSHRGVDNVVVPLVAYLALVALGV